MKFYNTIFNRNNAVLFLIIVFNSSVLAQKGTQSPYSVFGVGELNQGQYAAFAAMGGVSVANSDSTIATNSNPALYSYVERYRPIFQIGLNGRFSTFSTTSNSTVQRHMGLNQFQLALPIKKNWGASIGILPYSFTGYTVTNYSIVGDDTLSQAINEGSGAITRAFLGVGYKAINHSYRDTSFSKRDTSYTLKTHVLSLGVNGNFLFGSSTKTQSYEFLTNVNSYNSRVNTALRLSDISADFGLNYQYFFRPANTDSIANGSVSIGLTYAPGFQLRAYQDLYSHNYVGSFYGGSYTYIYDTVELVRNFKGAVYIPEQYKLGAEYRIGWKPSRKGERLLRIGVEANFQKWSAYHEKFESDVYPSYYKDRLGLGVGLEYCPVIGNDPTINILARTNYRLGFNYTQTELTVNGTDLVNYGMTFGFGIPLNVNSTNTTINFGGSLGNMGTTDNGLINEKYVGFYFGLSIIPDRNELWFVKRKYD